MSEPKTMMLRFARWTRSCHTQVARTKKRPDKKRSALVPQTFREVADKGRYTYDVHSG